jgi:hypothetical protein
MRKSLVLAIFAAGVSAFAAFLLGISGSRDASQQAVDMRSELAALSADVNGLKRNLHVQRVTARAVQESLTRAAVVVEDDESIAEERQPVEPDPKPELTFQEELNNLGVKFSEERRDAEWGRASTPVAANELQTYLPADSHVTDLECRESLCRAETVHANVDRYREFMRATGVLRKWEGPSIVRIIGETGPGPIRSVMYFAKRGVDLRELAMAEE